MVRISHLIAPLPCVYSQHSVAHFKYALLKRARI